MLYVSKVLKKGGKKVKKSLKNIIFILLIVTVVFETAIIVYSNISHTTSLEADESNEPEMDSSVLCTCESNEYGTDLNNNVANTDDSGKAETASKNNVTNTNESNESETESKNNVTDTGEGSEPDSKNNVTGTAESNKPESDSNYSVTGAVKNITYDNTPVGKHGALSVENISQYKAPTIVDKNNNPVQLRAVSTHGVQWFPQYINQSAIQSLRDEWGMNTIRLAVYPREGGYLQGNQKSMDDKIEEGVKAAKELGMYVIIDWHVLAYNPNEDMDAAKNFFQKYATMYKDYDNVIFEICNEPTGTPWYNQSGNDLYTYCKAVSKVIRDCGNDSIIICGTNDWSQRVDEVAQKPLKDDGFENIMYSIHFYAATHYDSIKNNFNKAIESQTPVFASEFGCCDASGNGAYDFSNADDWMKLFKENNISYACWSLCNKAESASCIKSSCSKTSNWTADDLTQTGLWLIKTSRSFEESQGSSSDSINNAENKTSQNGTSENEVSQQDKSGADKTGASSGISTKIDIASEWETGIAVNGVVRNTGNSDIDDWTLEFDLDGEISEIWCVKIVEHKGMHYVVEPEDYSKKIPVGGEITFGFNIKKGKNQTGNITNITNK